MSINPIRYPGGKGRKSIVDRIISLYPTGHLNNRIIIEPFCGGCGFSLSLLERDVASIAFLNDGDIRIALMWQAMAYETQRFIEDLENTNASVSAWSSAKKTANDENASYYDRGFSAFLLNRFCRSGYIDGGIIGGNKQEGKYKIDARFNKKTLIPRIKQIGEYAKQGRIFFFYGDAIIFTRNIVKKDLDALSDMMLVGNKNSIKPLLISALNKLQDKANRPFFYFDPPYIVKGASCYKRGCDHGKISGFIKNELAEEWLLSYDDCEEVRALYDNCIFDYLDITYSNNAKTRGKTSEVLIRPEKFCAYNEQKQINHIKA